MLLALANIEGRVWDLPHNAALHGTALDIHMLLNLWIALALVALAHLLLLAGLAVRRNKGPGLRPFRENGIGQGPEGHFSIQSALLLEYLPLAALTLLFAWLAVRSQQLWAAQRYTGADPSAMQVEVTGEQFAWYFRYPGNDAAFGQTKLALVSAGAGNPLGIDPADAKGADDFATSQLVLPVGREVDLTLRSLDVIHGFAVPEMRLKQNAVPGQVSHIHFTPTATGDFAVLCTQVCGLGHYRMQAVLRVMTVAEFDAWVKMHEVRR